MSKRARTSTFDDVWNELLEGIKHIYQFKPVTSQTFMELYRYL
jgi:hypothetical protein